MNSLRKVLLLVTLLVVLLSVTVSVSAQTGSATVSNVKLVESEDEKGFYVLFDLRMVGYQNQPVRVELYGIDRETGELMQASETSPFQDQDGNFTLQKTVYPCCSDTLFEPFAGPYTMDQPYVWYTDLPDSLDRFIPYIAVKEEIDGELYTIAELTGFGSPEPFDAPTKGATINSIGSGYYEYGITIFVDASVYGPVNSDYSVAVWLLDEDEVLHVDAVSDDFSDIYGFLHTGVMQNAGGKTQMSFVVRFPYEALPAGNYGLIPYIEIRPGGKGLNTMPLDQILAEELVIGVSNN